jgi:outer membrane usher protein
LPRGAVPSIPPRDASTLYYASLSIPFGRTRPATLSTNFARDTRGSTQVQTNLSGSVGVDNNVSYGLNVNHSSGAGNAQTNGGANVMYRAPFAELATSVGASADYQQLSFGARGAVVAHRGGVTLSQPLSETFGIVEAPNAEGARITNVSGVRVDRRGYAIVPYLTPFMMNDIELDPKGVSTDVELHETNQRVAPLAGAVPMLTFKTTYGRSAVIQMRLADGEPVPFGAVVLDDANKEIGVVGQASKAFVRGLNDKGNLTVKWGEGGVSACRIAYELPTAQRKRGATVGQPPLKGVCTPATVAAGLK